MTTCGSHRPSSVSRCRCSSTTTAHPNQHLNEFFDHLPSTGARAPKTWKAYAHDIDKWAEWLLGSGFDLLAPAADLRRQHDAYQAHRFTGPLTARWDPATWNRSVQALVRFYRWALQEGLMDGLPFYFKRIKMRRDGEAPETVEVNQAKVKDGKPHAKIQWLEADFLHMLITVGMSGVLPNGDFDPMFRGRNAGRNRAVTAFAAATGTRVQEFSSLLVWELPEMPAGRRPFVPLPLAPAICKRGRGRTTWITPDALKATHEYVRLERELATTGSTWLPPGPLYATEPTPRGGRVNGRAVKWATLGPEERQRLVAPGGGSAMLFVSMHGAPVEDWSDTFDRASERCQRYIANFPHVTPHMMRHTFAVHTLRQLVGRQLADLAKTVEQAQEHRWIAALRTSNPLLIVRDLLGHKSVKTTEKYLALIDTARLFTDAPNLADLESLGELAAPWPPLSMPRPDSNLVSS